MGRRQLLQRAAAGAATLALAATASPRSATASDLARATPISANNSPAASPAAADAAATPVATGLVGYAFNAKSQDVTLFDPVTRQPIATKPLGAVVRWLSNEQRFWDGRHIWTYDFPDNEVQAIAIDPLEMGVARTLPSGGQGPAHSLMLTPDLTQAWVNVAGDDQVVIFDVASGEVTATIATGAFP